MTASKLIARARSLSDTPNSLFISHDDEVNGLYESWKDIYSKITDSSDDYYLISVILPTTTAIKLGESEWQLALPDDVFKIRFVNYMDSGSWFEMEKFNTGNRNRNSGTPMYRWRGEYLWITGSLPSQIRLEYYPPPVMPSVPELSYNYALSYPLYQIPNISMPAFFTVKNPNMQDNTDYIIYIFNGTSIIVESMTLNSILTLYTGTGLSNAVYYLGYVYYISGGDIYRVPTNLVSAILTIPTKITTSTSITNFTIYNSVIYYSDGTNTSICNLDGTNVTVLYAYPTKCNYNGYNIRMSDGFIYNGGISTGISASSLTANPDFMFYVDLSGNLHRYTATEDTTILGDVAYIGMLQSNFFPVINKNMTIIAKSSLPDTDFVYPLNEANEIMAYSSAIEYKRKQQGDPSLLMSRLGEIWTRFEEVLKRDEGLPERRKREVPYYNY